jgi:hypothetical protein
MVCAVLLVGWQITSWLQKGAWDVFSVSSLIKRIEHDHVAAYAMASADRPATDLIDKSPVVDWLLAVPAIVPLVIATALLFGFYIWLDKVEKSAN